MSTIIVGHKNPDTDSVVSAIVYSELKKQLGENTTPYIAGEPNKETRFVLSNFGVETPQIISSVSDQKIILVDHNEAGQSPEGIEKSEILEVVDHHRIAGFTTEQPILYRAEPIGSTSSVIYKIFKEKGLVPTKTQARLLLCGIISDTLKLTSPTTTEEDRSIIKELEQTTEININEIAAKMFEAKSDITGISLDDIINQDFKDVETGKGKIGIGIYETTNPSALNTIKEDVIKLLFEKKSKDNLRLVFFATVDIIEQKSYLYIISDEEKAVAEKAFNMTADGNTMILNGVVSRKKQILPPLLETLK